MIRFDDGRVLLTMQEGQEALELLRKAEQLLQTASLQPELHYTERLRRFVSAAAYTERG